ncbi:MAG TPA: hypothetical protein VNN20_17715 [Thermodesulfobacteriota bacterium]|jgi:hypothetical protein|nr:hypothetical protein [Thermodesulfobacteriota bacterium]
MSESCIRKTLSTFPYGNIQECSCGGYYVTFGYVTLRLSYAELKSYAETLNKVVESIEGNPDDTYPRAMANNRILGKNTT